MDEDDYRWLVGSSAEPWLALAADAGDAPLAAAGRLRRDLTPARARLVLQQATLRRRAAVKFGARAAAMFFTARGLEQATDPVVAAHKAARYPTGAAVVDLCSGVGGDLTELAARASAVGVDRDPVTALFASHNARAEVRCEEVRGNMVGDFALWHIDPDRRADGQRSTRIERYEPGPDAIDAMVRLKPAGAVKLAPAANVPERWASDAELEWIEHQRECKQLVAWFGPLAHRPGGRRATVLDRDGGVHEVGGGMSGTSADGVRAEIPIAAGIGRYVFEPKAAVLAAGLVGELAAQHGLSAIAPGVAYLTGDRAVDAGTLSCFAVTDAMPFRPKQLKAVLRARGIGRLEVKKRAVPFDPAKVARQLAVPGDQTATLLLTRIGSAVTAILAQRVRPSGS
jgi:hypothetical protein